MHLIIMNKAGDVEVVEQESAEEISTSTGQ